MKYTPPHVFWASKTGGEVLRMLDFSLDKPLQTPPLVEIFQFLPSPHTPQKGGCD